MEKEKFFLNSSSGLVPTFLNLNWDNSKYSMEQMDPFESALSSMVSSPAASNAGAPPPDGVVIRELIGRLGSICNSGEISSQSQTYMGGININSTNHSGYSTPLNSPPKLNLSMMDQQIRGNLTISENARHDFAPFSADPGFAERAAKYSCFGSQNFGGLELPYRSASMVESGMLSRVSSSQSLKALSQMGVSESKDMASQERSSTPDEAELSNGREESSVSAQLTTANEMSGRKRKAASKSKSKEKNPKASEDNDDSNAKRSKSSEGAITEKNATKAKVEQSGSQKQKDSSKPPEPPKDYIHVRARRGQATDSHSLAERVRREKISKRMKFLQDLVPGCNKVTGKAVMLDEIINYVQSLQRQVEFLSMKLATMNPSQDLNLEALLSKNIIQSREGSQQAGYSLDSSASGFSFSHQRLLGPIQSVVTNGSEVHSSDNQLSATLHRGLGVQFSSMDGFGDASSQLTNFWEDDLQSVIQLGFEQNQELAFPSQSFHGSLSTAHTKTEL